MVVPLASSVCPLVDEVGTGACAGFLTGRLVSSLLELGLVPLIGRAVSSGVF